MIISHLRLQDSNYRDEICWKKKTAFYISLLNSQSRGKVLSVTNLAAREEAEMVKIITYSFTPQVNKNRTAYF